MSQPPFAMSQPPRPSQRPSKLLASAMAPNSNGVASPLPRFRAQKRLACARPQSNSEGLRHQAHAIKPLANGTVGVFPLLARALRSDVGLASLLRLPSELCRNHKQQAALQQNAFGGNGLRSPGPKTLTRAWAWRRARKLRRTAPNDCAYACRKARAQPA